MAINIASGYIDNINSNTTFTLDVGFRPKAGIFWSVRVNNSGYESTNHEASVGYWQNNNGTSVYACHAVYRQGSSSSYAASYTDCIAANITSTSRSSYITVSNISSTGITLSRSGSTSNKWRLHWILFGGDVVARVGTVTTPSGSTWNPVTVPWAGFDVLFCSFNKATTSTISSGVLVSSLIVQYDQNRDQYIYTYNVLDADTIQPAHVVDIGTESRAYVSDGSSRHLQVKNTNNKTDLLIQRGNSNVSYSSYSFAYLSLKSIPAFAGRFLVTNTTTNEENKTYTLPRPPQLFLAVASAWNNNTFYSREAHSAFSVFTIGPDTTSGYSLSHISTYLYAYSSANRVHIPVVNVNTNHTNSYLEHTSINNTTWSFKAKAYSANTSVPVFILGLGETSFRLSVSSNSSKVLSRRVHRLRTITESSTSDALLFIASAAEQLLSVASESLSSLSRGFSEMLSTSSEHLSQLFKKFFAFLTRSDSYSVGLSTLLNKLLHVVSSFSVILRLPENFSAVLSVVNESLATLIKRIFKTLETDSEQTSKLEKTIPILLQAFSSWQAWMILLIKKLLEVISDTRNDLERNVTYLFRQWEQELHAVSTSLSEIFRTFFRELLAETYQWVRMERIRGPVFALRSWLWRVGRRKHGCS